MLDDQKQVDADLAVASRDLASAEQVCQTPPSGTTTGPSQPGGPTTTTDPSATRRRAHR